MPFLLEMQTGKFSRVLWVLIMFYCRKHVFSRTSASVYGIRAFPDCFPMKCSWENPDYLKITLNLLIKAEANASPNAIWVAICWFLPRTWDSLCNFRFPPSSYSYIAILCADSAGTFHSWRESIFSNNWNIYLLYKLWNILEYYRIN